jgi:kynurenine formamidase
VRIDLSCKIDKDTLKRLGGAIQSLSWDKAGHIGTHFDVMDKEFPIEKIITKGRIFDISDLGKKVVLGDLDISTVQVGDFIMFHSGILKQWGYGTKEYISTYVELLDELIDALISKQVSFIGVDMASVKNPQDHLRIDKYCADNGIFIIENLNNLDVVLKKTKGNDFTVYTFPMNMSGFSGLPCRIIAEI